MINKLARRLNQFCRRADGNVTVFFALGLVAMIAGAGAAVDFAGANFSQTDADAAADAAVLTALKNAENAYLDGHAGWKAEGQQAGKTAFLTNLTTKAHLKPLDTNIDITRAGNKFSAELTYSVEYPTTLMALLGKNEVIISNKVSAASGAPGYIAIHLLIDVSGSMGIAATTADEAIVNNVNAAVNPGMGGTGCGFACHFNESGGVLSTRDQVKAAGGHIRLDIVTDAVKQFLQDAKKLGYGSKQIEVSIDTFSNSLMEIQAPTTNIQQAIKAADTIDLVDQPQQGGSNMRQALKQLGDKVPPSGDGSSPSERKSFVILLSDGVESSRKYVPSAAPPALDFGPIQANGVMDENFVPENPQHNGGLETVQAFNAGSCDALKQSGHQVFTTAVEYLIPNTDRDTALLDFIKTKLVDSGAITKSFEACASDPTMAYHAKASSEIAPMFKSVLDQIVSSSVAVLTK